MPAPFKPRLQRLDWLFTDQPLYFITAATHDRRRLLDNDSVHQALRAFAGKAQERGVFVGRYILMPDHLHLFVAIAPRGPRLSKWMQILKIALAKSLRMEGHAGPSWRKGFFDHVLRSQESYAQKRAYVQLNPIRAGLVSRVEEWPYQGEIVPLRF